MRRYIIGSTAFEPEKPEPGLYAIATPIGNLGDITIRALAILAASDLVLCEDTRVSSRLMSRYGIATRLAPYHDHNAAKLRPGLLAKLAGGAVISLISDAGTPLVSDPGYKLMRDAIAAGHRVEALPGPSAVLTALAVSGLPPDRFLFAGFLPSKAGERRHFLEDLAAIAATLIVYESPNRIVEALGDVEMVLGDRPVAVTRELTKLHEEVLRGKASEIAALLGQREHVKGEITLVIGPPMNGPSAHSQADIDASLMEAAQSLSASQAAATVARHFGIAKKDAYARLLALRQE